MIIQEKQVRLLFPLLLILRQKSPEHYLLHILVHQFHQFMVKEGTILQIQVKLFNVIQVSSMIKFRIGI